MPPRPAAVPAISAQGLSKRYRTGQLGASYDRIGEAILHMIRQGIDPRARTERVRVVGGATFWALWDVSFDVAEGEAVGIIGRNGSGKSTLLKVLSRITRPTEGTAQLRGQVASLLEVGTGFHPDLTGRENIYLNGAILGARKQMIDARFDDIAAFAGVELFIDTPLKRYSTGMTTRLAFAVAAYLEPEILLVDEVLAVGDMEFQRRCLGRMEEVTHQGRTVVFVSHQINQVRRLCERVIWLDAGRIVADGPAAQVISAYEQAMMAKQPANGAGRPVRPTVGFTSWRLDGGGGEADNVLVDHDRVRAEFTLILEQGLRAREYEVTLVDVDDRLMWGKAWQDVAFAPGPNVLTLGFPSLPLRPGTYFWRLVLHGDEGPIDAWEAAPPLIIATENHQHHRDQSSGMLNVPVQLSVSSPEGARD